MGLFEFAQWQQVFHGKLDQCVKYFRTSSTSFHTMNNKTTLVEVNISKLEGRKVVGRQRKMFFINPKMQYGYLC